MKPWGPLIPRWAGAWAFLVLLCWSLGAQALSLSAGQSQWLKDHPVLRLGVTDLPPLLLRDKAAGRYVGLSMDLLRALETRLGVRFQPVYYANLQDQMEGARKREVDVLAAVVPSRERSAYLNFTDPYVNLDNKILVRRDSGLGDLTLAQLRGRKISLLAGSSTEERLRRLGYGPSLVPAPDAVSTLTKLAFGEVDVAILDLARASYFIQQEGLSTLEIGGSAELPVVFALGSRNDWPELSPILQRALDDFPDQDRQVIQNRWLNLGGVDRETVQRWWLWGGTAFAGVLLLLGLILLWNRTLRHQVDARTRELHARMADQERVDQELRESEARFRDLVELSSDWWWEQDAQLRFSFLSDNSRLKGQVPIDYYLGKTRGELGVQGVTGEELARHEGDLAARRPFVDFTYRFRGQDGAYHWYSVSGRPLTDPSGNFLGYRGVARDITGEREAQLALAASERQLRGLLDSTESFLGLLDPSGVILEANRSFLAGNGLDRAQTVGRRAWEVGWWSQVSASAERLRQGIARAAAGETVRYVAEFPDLQGNPGWLDFSLTPVRNEAGQVTCIIPEGRDVTERHRVQLALELLVKNTATVSGEAFLRSLVGNLADLFHARAVFVSRLGDEPDRVHTLAYWCDGMVQDNLVLDTSASPCQAVLDEGPLLVADGVLERYPHSAFLASLEARSYLGAPILGTDQRPLGVLAVIDDRPLALASDFLPLLGLFALRAGMEMGRMDHDQAIRSLNGELERRVAERTSQLESANQELEAFSYSVSHDLRAPLRHVAGFVELLAEDRDNRLTGESQRYLGIITDAARRMGELIDGLLAFSRIGRAQLHPGPVDVNKLVAEVRDELAGEAQAGEVVWQVADLPQVWADRTLLRQIWTNLLANALKYSKNRSPARIWVDAMPGEKEWVFRVQDNGVGFNMKYVAKLFGVFQRLHSSVDFEGNGIGLANVRRMVERHGGRVWAEGAPDQGASFYFSLPQGEGAEEA